MREFPVPKCPVCELNFPDLLPDSCSRCVWDIKNDPLFITSLDPLPVELLDEWRQRRELAKSLWKEREQFEAKVSEQRFWKVCQERDTIEALNEYLQKYPHGIYSGETKKIIQQAENEKLEKEQFDQDLADWNRCKEKRTVSAIQSYIAHHPTGRFANEARELLKEFKQQQQNQAEKERLENEKTSQDQADWEQCKAICSIFALQGYIDRHPDGRFVTEARKLLRIIQEEQRQQAEKLEKERAQQRQADWENRTQQTKRASNKSKKKQPQKANPEIFDWEHFSKSKPLPDWFFPTIVTLIVVGAIILGGYKFYVNYPVLTALLFFISLIVICNLVENKTIKAITAILIVIIPLYWLMEIIDDLGRSLFRFFF